MTVNEDNNDKTNALDKLTFISVLLINTEREMSYLQNHGWILLERKLLLLGVEICICSH